MSAGLVSPRLVGRDEQLAALVAAAGEAPAVVVVEGEAGVGKSRLIAELLDRPELAKHRHLSGQSQQIREPFPLGAIIEAVRGLEADLGALRLSPVAGALRPLLPELAAQLPPMPEPLDDRVAERHRVFRGLVDALGAAGPCVLVVEDLHWADEQTLDFLGYLAGQLPDDLSLVVSYRSEEAAPAARILSSIAARVGRAHIALEPLGESDTGALAAAILGLDHISDEFAGYLWERSSGLPFAIEEVLALVQARGQLVQRHGRWSRRALDELEVPQGISHSTMERLLRLPLPARRLAEAAAVLQQPQPAGVLLTMTEEASSVDALDAAIDAAMLVERENRVGFRHPLAAQAVYESLSTARRQQLHTRAAAILQGHSTLPRAQIAHHLKRAGLLAEWSEAAELAADQAVELGHEDEAVRLLADVLDDGPIAGDRRGRVAAKLGWAAIDTLHAREIVEPLSEVLAHDLDGATGGHLTGRLRGELRFLLAIALGQVGEDPSRQRQLFLDSLADLDDRPDLRAWAMVALSLTATQDVPPAEDLKWLWQAVDLVDQVDDRLLQVFVLGKAGSVLLDTGDPAWRGIADRVRQIAGDAPRQRREANAYYSLGLAAAYAGHLQTAESLLMIGLAAPAAQQNQRLTTMLGSALAVQRYLSGRWAGLGDEVDQLLIEAADYGTIRMDLELVAGCLAMARGDLEAALPLLERSATIAVELELHDVVPLAVGSWARANLAIGDAAAAVACVELAGKVFEATKGVSLGWALPDVTSALVAAGRTDDAGRLLDRAAGTFRDRDAPVVTPALRRSRALLAAAAGETRAAAEQLGKAAEEYHQIAAPYDAALATEQAAECLLADGDELGRSALQEAVTAYDTLGARRDRTRAAGLARKHGVSLPGQRRSGRRGYGEALSPREAEVAALAAAGRTNGEISQQLFISVNTVEKHLSAVLRKSGVRSRTELSARWAEAKNGRFP